ncbi:Ras-related protein RABF1 [Tritrichomonas foetus]|uniref:Ras-related protein RABF1 n=1 Tax=Tritrichomonas foetus TaxID=1144522 RepID=A0A1J4KEJ1_9EUKA|nr:Ras-related protein RABF1 [Tritrichomonas foetus]|eukprot:OHT08156.1 Ras-related protein RABF1 [Tritrichomonas foetus]
MGQVKFTLIIMNHLDVKIVIVGSTDVGKTCIVNRACNDIFDLESKPTAGANYSNIIEFIENTEISLQIWDTAGQERYRSMAPMYYHGAAAQIIVYSIIDESSFKAIDDWYQNITQSSDSGKINLYLIGNKSDLIDNPKYKDSIVPRDKALQKAESINAQFFEVSALTGEGIKELFHFVAANYYENSVEENKSRTIVAEFDLNEKVLNHHVAEFPL